MSDEMQEILNDFLTESNEMLEVLDQRFVTLESDPNNTDLLNEIFRAMHSMKGSAGFLGFNHLVDVAHRGENILNKLRQAEMAVSPTIISVILETIDVIKAIMADIRESGTDNHVATAAIASKLDDIINGTVSTAAPAVAPKVEASAPVQEAPAPPTLGEILVNEGLASKDQVLDALNAQQHQAEPKTPLGEILLQAKAITERALDQALHKQEKQPKPAEEDATIRVETKRLDSVMNLVGELVLGRNRLIKIGTQLEQNHEADPQVRVLSETLAQLNLVTTDLQLAVMKTRMLPIKKVFAKLPRMVRDLSQKLNKQVQLEMRGEETELDKSVADEIGDPLVHLVRNAIDHGIETPAERQAKGKQAGGQLTIAASQEGNSIVIRINDDGRGIQVEKIKAKALAKGLISEAELATMEHREVLNLIFLPGFSTAEQVTDVSGRGVGMDVVRTNIRKINGSVDLESEPGKGSQIIIKLPLTIAIIQALMVEVERSIFAIPLSTVIEAVRISRSDIKTINGREVLHLRDRVLPLIRLAQEFDIPTDKERERFYVVVAALGDRRVGVVVDELRSQEEVVIKSIWDYLETVKGVSGATITGEGKVVLILDTSELVQNAQAWHNSGIAV
ncbi:MAG: chemotaxis protein CheA [Nitrospira sp.]|mgnify:CR=1 FL=1|jgi:two-component system chemotaxis sensor kinase CheA|nr:chemotaxis protein CheA [Nitrospira sp.]MBP8199671.1 chemotaxis protein CheA [Nitrospira sp.]MBP9634614.1 chemotaxis protein CheA [Nitrospira sp.]HQZ67270.1 chemotaxis protein CheA [Planctomycetaceae bacterium]